MKILILSSLNHTATARLVIVNLPPKMPEPRCVEPRIEPPEAKMNSKVGLFGILVVLAAREVTYG
jgi:hypothetical protein